MSKLAPIIIIAFAAIGGAGGGYIAKSKSVAAAAAAKAAMHADAGEQIKNAEKIEPMKGDASKDATHEKGDKTANAAKKKKDKDKSKKGAKSKKGDAKNLTNFMKFQRQFVVPIVQNGVPQSMMILDLHLETNQKAEGVYLRESVIRDAILMRLLILGSEGALPKVLEDAEAMQYVKDELLLAAQSVIGEAAESILILDIGIQTY